MSQKLHQFLNTKILGQAYALSQVSRTVGVGLGGVVFPGKPVCSCLFLGPTGVGKTECAKTLASFCFEGRMVRLDCGNFTDPVLSPMEVRREFDGSIPTHGEQGAVLLLDEIEKAPPQVGKLLLSAVAEGQVTGAAGQSYDLSKWIIIVTSNLGCNDLIHMRRSAPATLQKVGMDAVSQYFGPEWGARFDVCTVFQLLSREVQWQLAEVVMKEVAGITKERLNIELSWGLEVLEFLVGKGADVKLGARPLRKTIRTEVGVVVTGVGSDLESGVLYVHDGVLKLKEKGALEDQEDVSSEITRALVSQSRQFAVDSIKGGEIGCWRIDGDKVGEEWGAYKEEQGKEIQFLSWAHEWTDERTDAGRWQLNQAFVHAKRQTTK